MTQKHKQIKSRYTKDRVILSEVLPYEVPLHFSNRKFYEFIVKNKIQFKNGKIESSIKSNDNLNKIINILNCDLQSIPFNFKIRHKEDNFRILTIFHPINQLKSIQFYQSYKELILYYSSISNFSVRKPVQVATEFYYEDSIYNEKSAHRQTQSTIEEEGNEYDSLRSFFVYKDYSNVYKIYESRKFHQLEKKYDKLVKLDIAKCFPSIYTHSISWALNGGKEIVKDDKENDKKTFAGKFDKLMQELNYNETNGIVIGSELSRIFSELILQAIDRSVEIELLKNGIKHKVNYVILRYVDDYFVFYNDDNTKQEILKTLEIKLSEYKLSLNDGKQKLYTKPIITEISILKNKIEDFFNDIYDSVKKAYKNTEKIKFPKTQNLITKFKILIKESSLEYKDISSYSLILIEKKIQRILKITKDDERQNMILKDVIFNTIELSFFIYFGCPRINQTIKICRIINEILIFYPKESLNIVYQIIYENIALALKKFTIDDTCQIETINLLLLSMELGEDYLLDESLLSRYIGLDNVKNLNHLNYFSITSLLIYIKDNQKYSAIKKNIELSILNIVKRYSQNLQKDKKMKKDTELILFFFDILSSPYVTIETKYEILTEYGIKNDKDIFIDNLFSFTDWNFKLGKALDFKKSCNVY